MKVAVIGANGYIGKHLVQYMNSKGWTVRSYGRSASNHGVDVPHQLLDVTKRDDFDQLETDVDQIFYFAGVTGTIKAYNEYEQYLDVNVKGLIHLLDWIRQKQIHPKVIYPSTRLVYKGVTNTALDENSEKEQKTLYASSKWMAEKVLMQYHHYFNIPFGIYRICVPYGNNFNSDYSYGTIGFFLSNVRAGKPINLYGDGSLQRTFTHVNDICSQIVETSVQQESDNEIFNISGETFSLRQVADMIAAAFSGTVTTSPWPEIDLKLESGDTIFADNKILAIKGSDRSCRFADWLKSL